LTTDCLGVVGVEVGGDHVGADSGSIAVQVGQNVGDHVLHLVDIRETPAPLRLQRLEALQAHLAVADHYKDSSIKTSPNSSKRFSSPLLP
jgi:hypothetical protein